MNKTKLLLLAVGAALALGGCAGKTEETGTQIPVKQEQKPDAGKPETPKTETPPASTTDASKPQPAPNTDKKPENAQQGNQAKIDLEFVKTKLKEPLTQEQVKKLLGDKYAKVASAMDNAQVWRYDIEPKDGYKFESPDDSVDIEGIEKKKLKAQLFITWDKEAKKTDGASFAYLDEKKNKIYNYYAGGELDGKLDEIK